jgi:putative flippase GtrA
VIRWLKFNAVGIVGALIQLILLWLLTRGGVHYLIATAMAVEAAILHNFYWHVRWTWKGRHPSLLRFHMANGVVSILSNLALMKLFTGIIGIGPVPANLAAIGITSLVNFFLGDRWVFLPAARERLDGGVERSF